MARDGNQLQPVEFPFQLGGLDTTTPASRVYPGAVEATNVRFGLSGEVIFRDGFTTYNSTAMPATIRVVTGLAQFNRRDTTTRYTICGTQEKLFVVPTSGAWTTLASSLGATATDFWDFAAFNNEMICVNGVSAPRWTDGTSSGTSAAGGIWQTRTASSFTRGGAPFAGVTGASDVDIFVAGGTTVNNASADALAESYDTIGDAWSARTSMAAGKSSAGIFSAYGRHFGAGGSDENGGGSVVATATSYNPAMDTWSSIANITAGKSQPCGLSINNAGYVVAGSTTGADAGAVTTNYKYDPATDTWSTKTAITTARWGAQGANIGDWGMVTGGLSTAGAYLTDSRGYDPFTDAWTNPTSVTVAKAQGSAVSGPQDNTMSAISGLTTGASAVTTHYSYNRGTNAWTTSTAVTAATSRGMDSLAGVFMYVGSSSATYRYNATPVPPVAFYVESFRGYLIMARTSSFPSRVFYSVAGDSRQWRQESFFDVNPDDGDWITGMFVFNGRLYVSKTDTIYEITGSVFDPEEGDMSIAPLENVKGTVSNRSIVVSDTGVYYLAEDGFRRFDGVRSEKISRPIQTTLEGYVASRFKYATGLWNRAKDEIWWSMTGSGSTHNRIVVYNTRLQFWSIYTGIAAESMANVEDANDVDQLLFGTADTSDGKIYTAESGNTDNGTTISCVYQTGWAFPLTALRPMMATKAYLMLKRFSSSVPTLTFSVRTNFSASDASDANNATLSHSIALNGTAASSPAYFEDASDERARVDLGFEGSPHALSLRFAHNANADRCEIYGAVIAGAVSTAGGGYPD